MLKKIQKSIYIKIMIAIVAALFFVVFLLAVSNVYLIERYLDRAREVYQGSLMYYCTFWEDKFKGINTSLLTMIGKNYGEDFRLLCESDDALYVEISKMTMQERLTETAYMYDEQVGLFIYVPERGIYVRSGNRIGSYTDSLKNDEMIKDYIENQEIHNNNTWNLLVNDENYFLIQVYHMGNGYAGAVIECKTIFENLLGNGGNGAETAVLLDNDQNVVAQQGTETLENSVEIFSHELGYTDFKLGIMTLKANIGGMGMLMGVLSACIILLGVIAIGVIFHYQWKVVIAPLTMLKNAMIEFGKGNTKVRLDEYGWENEIKILYQTFNDMIDEIMGLKIEVYENEIEKQRIQNKYLRVQIQPHFYTNILNLIYSFAEVRDYENIKNLSALISRYFRYSLNSGDYVTLQHELTCLNDYVNIQKIRYPDCIEWKMNCTIDDTKLMIPPLLLQTFVENSIKHNITLIPDLAVELTIWSREDAVCFSIKDNGTGFPEKLLEKIEKGESIEVDGKHIGIMNMKNRLELLYGDKAGITIKNLSQGSQVEIILRQISW